MSIDIHPGVNLPHHVTLRFPVYVKLMDKLVLVRSFDATTGCDAGMIGGSIEFNVDRIWAEVAPGTAKRDAGYRFNGRLTIPVDNIAGLIQQPFVSR
jgi:hypothetical protein